MDVSRWHGVTCLGKRLNGGSVTRLELVENNLANTLPTELAHLSSVEHFELAHNAHLTSSIPTELALLGNVQYFDLASNSLTSTIPSEFALLSNVEDFFLDQNFISGDGLLPGFRW